MMTRKSKRIQVQSSSTMRKCMSCLCRFVGTISDSIGPALVVCAILLYIGMGYTCFSLILPASIIHDISLNTKSLLGIGFQYTCVLSLGVFLFFSIAYNYIHCLTTDPGLIQAASKAAKQSNSSIDGNNKDEAFVVLDECDFDIEQGYLDVEQEFCSICQIFKPPDSHHCKVCRKCIKVMDHHCPWVNNCIGYYNYRFFWLFLLYVWVGCIYVFFLAKEPYFSLQINDEGIKKKQMGYIAQHPKAIKFTFLNSITVGIGVFCLWQWHLYLLLTSQTTMGFLRNSSSKKLSWEFYNNGEIRQNFQKVFGSDSFCFMAILIPNSRRPPIYQNF